MFKLIIGTAVGAAAGYYVAAQKATRDLEMVRTDNEATLQNGFQMAFQSGEKAKEAELREQMEKEIEERMKLLKADFDVKLEEARVDGFTKGQEDQKAADRKALDHLVEEHKRTVGAVQRERFEAGKQAALRDEQAVTEAYVKLVEPKLNLKKAELKKEYDETITRMKREHQDSIDKLVMEQNQIIDKMQEDHREVLDELRSVIADRDATIEANAGAVVEQIEQARQEGYKRALKETDVQGMVREARTEGYKQGVKDGREGAMSEAVPAHVEFPKPNE